MKRLALVVICLAVIAAPGALAQDAARLQAPLEELALAVKTVQRTLDEKGVCTTD